MPNMSQPQPTAIIMLVCHPPQQAIDKTLMMPNQARFYAFNTN